MKFVYDYGATPLDPNEKASLIPSHITLMSELNAFEHANIMQATQWANKSRFTLSLPYIKKLHQKMFSHTWKWAGCFRKTEKNIGVEIYQIETQLQLLCDDVAFQNRNHSYELDEIAARLHHRLVVIHPFPNGNGRHARLLTDMFLINNGCACFSWGGKQGGEADIRRQYIDALRQADNFDMIPLLKFVRS